MKRVFAIILSISSYSNGFLSQTIDLRPGGIICGMDEGLNSGVIINQKIGGNFQGTESIRQDSLDYLQAKLNKPTPSAPVYTIPIVFHVLHLGGMENISDAQIIDQVNILNRDYRKLNADTINIFAPFAASDARLEFRLATRDPNGNCTTGITRHYDVNTNWNYSDPSRYQYSWNSSQYLNIYVVKSIPSFVYGGFSSFPGTNTNAKDVIVIMNVSIGSIGTSAPYRSRSLTHEIGHWFNLQHPWAIGGTFNVSCGDDYVSDTPITKGWGTCPSSSSLSAVCNPTISENFQNYMDYAQYCKFMFTAGQVARMTAAVTSNISGRNNLWSTANLIATGIINPILPCPPIANFFANTYTVCVGGSIAFNDISYNGTILARTWSSTGSAVVSNSAAASTIINFPTVGTETISLMVSNGNGSSTATKVVTVLNGNANINAAYSESFEGAGLPTNFKIINPDNDVTWAQTSFAAATGNNSYFIDGSLDAPSTYNDILETPSYDFSIDPNATFTFKYAYAKKDGSNADKFLVQASSDCGGTWIDIYSFSNNSMALSSGGITNSPFYPNSNQFVTYTLSSHPNFSQFMGKPNVRIRFCFIEDQTTGFGNNIFLDDINFNSNTPTGFKELSQLLAFNLFPNPATDFFTLQFTLSTPSKISYFISDIFGNIVSSENRYIKEAGTYQVKLNEEGNLIPGLYFLNFNVDNRRLTRKLVIQ